MADCLDLRTFDEPILVFGGPYSNLEATQALLRAADSCGIPASHLLCTGDVVAYCADPQATVDLIREAGIAVVMGNCEESLGTNADDCGCAFVEGSACDALTEQWFEFARRSLDDDAKAWMRALPRRIQLTLAGQRLVAVHGTASRINRYIFGSSSRDEKLAECHRAGADGILGGHAGLPFTQVLDGRLWHNAGAIGLPANDATPRVWYSILRPLQGGIEIEHCVLEYDYKVAAAKMVAHKLPRPYANALGSGRWPADDILPQPERLHSGQALVPHRVFWPCPAGVLASA